MSGGRRDRQTYGQTNDYRVGSRTDEYVDRQSTIQSHESGQTKRPVQTNRQAVRRPSRQTRRRTWEACIDGWTARLSRQAERHADREASGHTDRKTNRHTDRKTNGHTDRKTNRHTEADEQTDEQMKLVGTASQLDRRRWYRCYRISS